MEYSDDLYLMAGKNSIKDDLFIHLESEQIINDSSIIATRMGLCGYFLETVN